MPPADIKGIWNIVSIDSNMFGSQSVMRSDLRTIEFDDDEITASDGLNVLSAEYELVGDRLGLSPGPSTAVGYDGRDVSQVRLSAVISDLMNSEEVSVAVLASHQLVLAFADGTVELSR